jgi:DnaJ-domain-containing protein 1
VGILQRISDLTRAGLTDLRQRTFGRSQKPLSELSDKELEEEILRRRRDRAQRSGREPSDLRRDSDSPRRKQIRQFYLNLELEPGASLDEVKRASRDLMARYHPDRHASDPDRHKAATELARSLTEAYRALSEYLQSRRAR